MYDIYYINGPSVSALVTDKQYVATALDNICKAYNDDPDEYTITKITEEEYNQLVKENHNGII